MVFMFGRKPMKGGFRRFKVAVVYFAAEDNFKTDLLLFERGGILELEKDCIFRRIYYIERFRDLK